MTLWSGSTVTLPVLCVLCGCLSSLVALDTTYRTQSRQEVCTASEVAQPGSIGEVSALVKKARAAGQKVKVVGTRHSTTDILCTSGLALDLSLMNAVEINSESMEVRAEAGATQEEVLMKLAEAGFTVIGPFVKFSGMTIGGILATGSLSSSIKHPASLSDQVTSLTLVDGLGEVHKITGEDLNAVRVNLGYLGVVTDVTLKIFNNFKTKLEAVRHDESMLFDGRLNTWAEQVDFAEALWFPHIQSVILITGTYLDINTPGTDRANYVFETTSDFIWGTDAASASRNVDFYCNAEAPNAQGWLTGHPGLPQLMSEDGKFTNPAIGLMSDMLTGSCPPGQCAWDRPVVQLLSQEVHLAIPMSVFPAALQDVRRILDERPMCTQSITGILLRFQGSSSNYISTAHGEAMGQFEVLQVLRQEDNQPHYGQATIQEMYQTLLVNFMGRPHWGKNARSSFSRPFRSMEEEYPEWPKFLAVKERLDPEGIFENDFYDRLTGRKEINKDRYCATDDKCVCGLDFHCADSQKCESIFLSNIKGGLCVG